MTEASQDLFVIFASSYSCQPRQAETNFRTAKSPYTSGPLNQQLFEEKLLDCKCNLSLSSCDIKL